MSNNQYSSYGGGGGSSNNSYANSYGGGSRSSNNSYGGGSSSYGGSSSSNNSYANSYGGGSSSYGGSGSGSSNNSYANSYGGGSSSYGGSSSSNNNHYDDEDNEDDYYNEDDEDDNDEEDEEDDEDDEDEEDEEDEEDDEDDEEDDEEYEPDPEAGEGYCSCGNICLVNSNRGLCIDCRNVNVRFGENTEHDTYASHRAVGYAENERYDRSYRSYTERGYRNRKDTEYDCLICEDGLVDNHYNVPGLIYCNSCLGYYSKERRRSYHKDEDWRPIEREERREWYENVNAHRAKNGQPPI
jgi:hypothetical protein